MAERRLPRGHFGWGAAADSLPPPEIASQFRPPHKWEALRTER